MESHIKVSIEDLSTVAGQKKVRAKIAMEETLGNNIHVYGDPSSTALAKSATKFPLSSELMDVLCRLTVRNYQDRSDLTVFLQKHYRHITTPGAAAIVIDKYMVSMDMQHHIIKNMPPENALQFCRGLGEGDILQVLEYNVHKYPTEILKSIVLHTLEDEEVAYQMRTLLRVIRSIPPRMEGGEFHLWVMEKFVGCIKACRLMDLPARLCKIEHSATGWVVTYPTVAELPLSRFKRSGDIDDYQ